MRPSVAGLAQVRERFLRASLGCCETSSGFLRIAERLVYLRTFSQCAGICIHKGLIDRNMECPRDRTIGLTSYL